MALPFLLFPIAQQWIDSSLAGMINGGVPIFAAMVAAIAIRRLPNKRQALGLMLGFAGVLTVGWPAIQGARSTALGVGLVLLGTISYGIAINVAVPLQQRYGSLPVLLRTQFVAIGLTVVPGLLAIPSSEFSTTALAAVIPLGCLGTALAFVGMTTLVGRVGAIRGSVTVYFIPIVAIALGALVRNESIHPLSIFGTAMVITGAFLASRSDTRPARAA
jgi:drug/metabolite transporter (DMT)-like permease